MIKVWVTKITKIRVNKIEVSWRENAWIYYHIHNTLSHLLIPNWPDLHKQVFERRAPGPGKNKISWKMFRDHRKFLADLLGSGRRVWSSRNKIGPSWINQNDHWPWRGRNVKQLQLSSLHNVTKYLINKLFDILI